MKNKLLYATSALGWILFLGSLGSSYIFNKFNNAENQFAFSPITWQEHLSIFDGAISCSLTSDELQERTAFLKTAIFSKLKKKVALENGFIFYFEDEEGLVGNIMDLIRLEKQCCPFFKFDFSVLPFNKGLALQISGSKEVKDFIMAMLLQENISVSLDSQDPAPTH